MLGMRYIKADPNTYLMQYRHGELKQAGKRKATLMERIGQLIISPELFESLTAKKGR